uniref:Uncharacterized protein n=1 Tax=Anguilla anguilla TaxID=7936 RepID=A0A0E9VGU3_ANGAN
MLKTITSIVYTKYTIYKGKYNFSVL